MSAKSANVQAKAICPKISFLLLVLESAIFKISHSAHSDKMLPLWIVLLDNLILNSMELLTSFKFFKDV